MESLEEDERELPRAPSADLTATATRLVASTHEVEGLGVFTVTVQDLGKSLFVHCSTGSKALGEVVSGVPLPPSSTTRGQVGASSVLLACGDGEGREDAEAFVAKLATKLQKLVLLSWNVDARFAVATGELQRLCISACAPLSG